jgi:Fe-S oxidoreductase
MTATTAVSRDIFVERFFLGGARKHIRKTFTNAPWLSLGILENMNPMAFYESRLFGEMNIIAGDYISLGHGLIHGYLAQSAEAHIRRAVNNLNTLPTKEIIFYHDESLCGLEQARAMGLKINFNPLSLLEWLVRTLEESHDVLRRVGAVAAVQLPCSAVTGPDRNGLINRILALCGVTRAQREFDLHNRRCCGVRGYYGLITMDTLKDTDRADNMVQQHINDAGKAGASHLITLCPMCFAALAPAARAAGLVPMQIEGLVSQALYGETLPDGIIFA